MKIKSVCELTNLTDRTIRYYIEEKLIIIKIAGLLFLLRSNIIRKYFKKVFGDIDSNEWL